MFACDLSMFVFHIFLPMYSILCCIAGCIVDIVHLVAIMSVGLQSNKLDFLRFLLCLYPPSMWGHRFTQPAMGQCHKYKL